MGATAPAMGDNCCKPALKNIDRRAKNLRFGDMAQILVRQLMGENAAQLVIRGAPQQTHGHVELAVAGVGGVDLAPD